MSTNAPKAMLSLEERIRIGLTDDIRSSAISTLIEEVEAAAAQAAAAAEQARARALDPTVIDPAAQAAVQDAEHTSRRLRAALPRLQRRLAEVQAAEYVARWEPDFRQVEAQCDELSAELAATYPKAVARLIDLLTRAKACDAEVDRINGAAPLGEPRRLRSVELVARGLTAFSRDNPPITKELRLPDWANSARIAWPPPQIPLGVLMAEGMAPAAHPGGDWWRVKEEEARAQRERQAREAAEREAKARADWRGPRWWEGERA